MKGPFGRTKVVLRHLPPTISQSVLMEQIDARFSGRYNWFCFRSGKNSLKCQSYSRIYIDFKGPEDTIEFAEFFDGHVFVNEKGTQCKTIAEYAPSQRVPKQSSKKDGLEGTIGKDPEYLEFLELIAKPVENLPSAEIQLERKEAGLAGFAKETPIVTPLMDFVRQKRAAKGGPRRSLPNGKVTRASGTSSSCSSPAKLKRGSGKRTLTTMYVPRDAGKSSGGKVKSNYFRVSKIGVADEERGGSDIGTKKVLLLKGKEKEISRHNSGAFKQNPRHDASGKIIILTKGTDKDRRSPRPPFFMDNSLQDDKIIHTLYNEKQDKRTWKNDRPDRGAWTPVGHSAESHEKRVWVQKSASGS